MKNVAKTKVFLTKVSLALPHKHSRLRVADKVVCIKNKKTSWELIRAVNVFQE